MSVVRTYLFGAVTGTDLRGLTGLSFRRAQWRAPGRRKGGDINLEYRQGEIEVSDLPLDAYTLSITVGVKGATPEAFDANLDAAMSVLLGAASDGLGVLTRRLPAVGGSGYVDTFTKARFLDGFTWDMRNPQIGETDLMFRNLRGGFTADSDDIDDLSATWTL